MLLGSTSLGMTMMATNLVECHMLLYGWHQSSVSKVRIVRRLTFTFECLFNFAKAASSNERKIYAQYTTWLYLSVKDPIVFLSFVRRILFDCLSLRRLSLYYLFNWERSLRSSVFFLISKNNDLLCFSLLNLVTCFTWFTSLLRPWYFIISYFGRVISYLGNIISCFCLIVLLIGFVGGATFVSLKWPMSRRVKRVKKRLEKLLILCSTMLVCALS